MQLSKLGLVVLPAVWLALLTATPNAAQEQSVTSGVYTDEQAARGEAAYNNECSSCHGAGLEGDGFAPALAGTEFLSNWNGTTLGDLFDRIRISMPPGSPRQCRRRQGRHRRAPVEVEQIPGRHTEIGKDLEPLKLIKIELPKSRGGPGTVPGGITRLCCSCTAPGQDR